MSTLTALARVEALAAGRAVPIATVRHVHLSDEPLVLVPLLLAGEAAAPLAALVGTDRAAPDLLVVEQPRNRDQRFAFLADLSRVVVRYIEQRRGATETVEPTKNREAWERYLDAPQVLVPNSGGIEALRLFGRSSRFRTADGLYPVDPLVPILGRYLTWFAEDRAATPGSSICLALTDVLGAHWASGQSALEDQQLATLVGWIDPPSGQSGAQAAAAAEDPGLFPPAGPTTDPRFDAAVLGPLIVRQQNAAGDPDAERAAESALRDALYSQLRPTWDTMWHGVDLLRTVSAAQHDEHRWMVDRGRFTEFSRQLDEGAPPQPRRDGAVAAAKRLSDLESAQESYDKQRALDDPLVLAQYRVTGEAFAGQVVAVDAERQDTSGRSPKPRPHVWIRTEDPVVLRPGVKVACPQRPGQRPVVIGAVPDGDGYLVELELVDGMGRKAVPEEGSVPEPGEYRCYATVLAAEWFAPPPLPEPAATPWTHGGAPHPFAPTGADQDEEWH
ncbi:MAG TPA: hypothetical protein VFU73_13130 [Actinocrinis sp.]|nr:hypothetical protein [Actinocrinis sp.]